MLKITNWKSWILIVILLLAPIILSESINLMEKYKMYGFISLSSSSTQFLVSSQSAWQDTGIVVNKGDTITIKSKGSIQFNSDGLIVTPDGLVTHGINEYATKDGDICVFPICGENIPSNSLVGRIGTPDLNDYTNGFFVGSDFSMVADKSGNLLLGFNDQFVKPDRSGLDSGGVGDNSGAFNAIIVIS